MANVLIVAYLLIVVALIAVILLQRSEGGGLGMGGNAGGLMTVRGSANLLTRTTAILAALFFATAIGLTVITGLDRPAQSILEGAGAGAGAAGGGEAPASVLDALNQLQGETAPAPESGSPAADPALAVPAAPATDAAPSTEAQPGTTTPPAAPTN